MNVEDQITYFVLKSLVHHRKDNSKSRSLYQQVVKKAEQIDSASTHIVADTMRLIDWRHNQFLNCVIKIKDQVNPVPDLQAGSPRTQAWVTHIGELELKRLKNDYRK